MNLVSQFKTLEYQDNLREIEQNKFVAPVSPIWRSLTHRVVDLSTYFDIIEESRDGNNNSSLK